MAERIQLSRRKGWRMPANTVKVDRTTNLGNLFIVGKHGTRAQCVSAFAMLAAGFISLGVDIDPDDQLALFQRIRRSRRTHAGKQAACWCSKSGPCHGDVLTYLWNGGSFHMLTQFHVEPRHSRLGMMAGDLLKLKRAKASRDRAEAAHG